MKNQKSLNQAGFAHIQLAVIVLVIAAVSFAGGYVYNAEQKKKESARQAEAAAKIEKQKELEEVKSKDDTEKITVEVPKTVEAAKPAPAPAPTSKPAPAPAPKPSAEVKKTAPTYTMVTIPSTNSSVDAENVTLSASLPASYTGTCKALVKLPDGSNAIWFEAAFSASNSCSVSVPKSKLSAGSSWKYYMYFKSADGTTKGESSSNTFSL